MKPLWDLVYHSPPLLSCWEESFIVMFICASTLLSVSSPLLHWPPRSPLYTTLGTHDPYHGRYILVRGISSRHARWAGPYGVFVRVRHSCNAGSPFPSPSHLNIFKVCKVTQKELSICIQRDSGTFDAGRFPPPYRVPHRVRREEQDSCVRQPQRWREGLSSR